MSWQARASQLAAVALNGAQGITLAIATNSKYDFGFGENGGLMTICPESRKLWPYA